MRYRSLVWALGGLVGGTIPVTPAPSAAQQVELVGRVVGPERRPLEGVEVIVNRQQLRATTDTTGVFTLQILPADSTIGFRRIGYRPAIFAIRPLPLVRDTLLVQLEPSAVVLPEVIVSAPATKPLRYAFTTKYDDVFHRRRIGLGTLVPREVIDARFGATTDQLLDGLAGIRVWNGPPKRLRFARCSGPRGIAIFINGVRQIPARSPSIGEDDKSGMLYRPPSSSFAKPTFEMEPEVEILTRINPSDVEMVEVFRGVSEIPAEFHWDGCAVIAIWTRTT